MRNHSNIFLILLCLYFFIVETGFSAYPQNNLTLKKTTIFCNSRALLEFEGEIKTENGIYRLSLPEGVTLENVHFEGDIVSLLSVKDSITLSTTPNNQISDALKGAIGKFVEIHSKVSSFVNVNTNNGGTKETMNASGFIKSVTNNEIILERFKQNIIIKLSDILTFRFPTQHTVEIKFRGKKNNQNLKMAYFSTQIDYLAHYTMKVNNGEANFKVNAHLINQSISITNSPINLSLESANLLANIEEKDNYVFTPQNGLVRNYPSNNISPKINFGEIKDLDIPTYTQVNYNIGEYTLKYDSIYLIGRSNFFHNSIKLSSRENYLTWAKETPEKVLFYNEIINYPYIQDGSFRDSVFR